MKKVENYLMPLGMIGVLVYILFVNLGDFLWKAYDPITMDISTLTAVGSPNAELLRVFSNIYGICVILFAVGMVIKSFRIYNWTTKIGYILLLVMELVSLFGYGLFPLEGDKTVMTFQNMMHIIVTVIVVLTTITFGFLVAIGYKKYDATRKLGKFIFIMAILITITGIINPIGMNAGWNILGVTERLVIYSVQILIFYVSFYYTFDREKLIVL